MDDQIIDRATARSLHIDACRVYSLVAWIVMFDPPDYSGKFIARLATGNHTPFLLLTDTLAGIRAALPLYLERSPRQPADLPEVIEIWFSR